MFCTIALILVLAQHAAEGASDDPYSIGVTFVQLQKSCPIFVGGVMKGSPAESAGVRAGDRLLRVDSSTMEDLAHALAALRSGDPSPVKLTISREGKAFEVTVKRERRSVIYAKNGLKSVQGVPVSFDTSDAEVERMIHFDGSRLVDRVFTRYHYPKDPDLFYPGFELFLLRNPVQVAVGGIEDSPASEAGVHWGDVIVSVDGVSVAGKSVSELEKLFSHSKPEVMRLNIDRLGKFRAVEFKLEKASDIAQRNGLRFENGHWVPTWATVQDLECIPQ